MNILVLSENFIRGGLETHIHTYWKYLKSKHNMLFCFANYRDTGLIDKESVYTGFHFSNRATVLELKEDVERLVDIINEKHIDVIHVHPWFALYAAYFAAAKTGVKLVYTYHGTVSLNYINNLSDQIIMEEIVTGAFAHVFCVGEQGLQSLLSMGYDLNNASVLVNPIRPEEYPYTKPDMDTPHRWALVSRLDADKVPAIERLLNMLQDLDIDQIDVYGNGNSLGYLQSIAEKTGKIVDFKGHTNEIGTVLSDNGYCGIIGLGRSAIEGLALGLPCLFVGYDKNVGLIDRDIYNKVKHQNFIPENYRDLGPDEINKQLALLYENPSDYILRDSVLEDFSISTIGQEYMRTLEKSYAKCPAYAIDVYNALIALDGIESIQLYNNTETYNLASSIILGKTRNLNVKKMIMISRMLDDVITHNKQVEKQLNNKLDEIINNMTLKK